MAIIWVCGAVLLASVVLGARWSRLRFTPPPVDPRGADGPRRYIWCCSLLLVAGITAGISVIGCGGRLAMRLLAVTAGDDAQGRITEAEEVVGRVTTDGTISFILFQGIFGGVVLTAGYLVIRRLLPPGVLGGLAFGAGLLVVLGTTSDPLRDENPDFDLVGPGWLAILVFTALALAFGVVLAGFVARLSAWLPLPSTDRATLARYAPVAVLAVVAYPVTILLAAVGVVVVPLTQWRALAAWLRSPVATRVGQGLLLALVAVCLPAAVQSLADIASRGPA